MQKHKAKKSVGQNFLTSPDIVKLIVNTGKVSACEDVVEIGPGKGVLTAELLLNGANLTAIEKDDDLYKYLNSRFDSEIVSGKLSLIHGDILKELGSIKFDKYKVIANIPYNITGKIISEFLSKNNKPKTMVLMVQYEVASRIAKSSEKKSILSLSVEAYGKATLVKKVSAGSFFPKPKVDSAILLIENISNDFFIKNNITEQYFFDVIHAGFAHKRKKLIRNLKDVFPEGAWFDIFLKLNLSENTRAEDIDLTTWANICKS